MHVRNKYAKRHGIAGADNGRGYLRVSVDKISYMAHRLAFLYMTGRWPLEIDHIDGNKKNNVWRNLREVTRTQNMNNNAHVMPRALSGIKGVRRQRGHRRWQATFRKQHLGYFDTAEEAGSAYEAAKSKYAKLMATPASY